MDVTGFIRNLKTRTSSAETLRAYQQDLAQYGEFLQKKGLQVNQARSSNISEFVAHISEGREKPLAAATIARKLAVISEYYEFLADGSGTSITNPVKRVKRPKVDNSLPRAVDDNTLSALDRGITDLRDRAILLVFVYSGLRLSELRQLDRTTIVTRKRRLPDGKFEPFGTGEVVGKGRKRRQFLLGPAALEALRDYIREHRTKDSNPALFLSERRQRISCRAIQEIVYRWTKRLGIPHVHIHQLRHSFATRNINGGMSAAVLQQLLGHANLGTSQRYFRVQPDRLSREYFSVMEFVRQSSPV